LECPVLHSLSAALDINANGIGQNDKAKTPIQGMFHKVNLNKGRAVQMAEDI
jgi:hypothetical protein